MNRPINPLLSIPEVVALAAPSRLIRIPNQIDVPITDRVMRLIDTPQFRRLTGISQLGMVSFVYPAANHNRFEHSLGVYRMSLMFLSHLAHQTRFAEMVDAHQAHRLILAALFHDIGHWPYCHPIEDLSLKGMPSHESYAENYLRQSEVVACLADDWGLTPDEIIDLINRNYRTDCDRMLGSILSGPIDIDKMDYLYRDSLHAGVPYGQNFDSQRLIRSLCIDPQHQRLAITNKGKTAAELMVFARYVMFSEVYWHHAVRSATAMFQRAFYGWYEEYHQQAEFEQRCERLFCQSDQELRSQLKQQAENPATAYLLERLFGSTRRLFKNVASYNCFQGEAIYRKLAQRPYAELLELNRRLAHLLSQRLGVTVAEHQVLIDAPPVKLEVQFNLPVVFANADSSSDSNLDIDQVISLGELSPVVQTLANRQFDDFVKQVRIFLDPELALQVKRLPDAMLLEL